MYDFMKVETYLDKKSNEIEICAIDKNYLVKSKHIICPMCGESTRLKFKTFKISLFECKNNHNIDNLTSKEFETSQLINLSDIACYTCKNNIGNTYKNQFYYCIDCKLNFCPLCFCNHSKIHKIIYYDFKPYVCDKHSERYNSFCKSCMINTCYSIKMSIRLIFISFDNLFIKKDDLKKKLNEFKSGIDKLKVNIKEIIDILNKVVDNFESFYNISSDIINNFDSEKINYQNLSNLNEIYNSDIIAQINKINILKIIRIR